jgi:hypothetical protein
MSNFWDKVAGNANQQQPVAPIYRQAPTPPTTSQPAYVPQELREHQLPASATSASRCPGCGSGNYSNDGQHKARCYDCGYPLQQSGSGVGKGIVGGPTPSGPAQPARQIATGGFQPQTIIGHI